jgi:hypothetical protein
MAKKKISELGSLAIPVVADEIVVLDISDTSQAASGTTKRATLNTIPISAATQTALDGKQTLDADLTALAAANNSTVLANTTASFLTADETKLDGIEAAADVTDATNVAAAGALMNSGAQVWNEVGAAVDFRAEGDTDANLFFIDGSADKIGFGTSAPAEKLQVIGNFQVSDAATSTKDYRFRTTGSSLDLDFSGQNLVLSGYPNANFGGAQKQYMTFGAEYDFVTMYSGSWEWKDRGTSTVQASISGETGAANFNDLNIDAALNHDGSTVGFYGTTPIAKQTGVAVSAAGVHAALVALGLISA